MRPRAGVGKRARRVLVAPAGRRSDLARRTAPALLFALGALACGGEPTPPPGPVARGGGLPALVALLPGDDTTLTLAAHDADGRRVPAPRLARTMHRDVDVNPLAARFADGDGSGVPHPRGSSSRRNPASACSGASSGSACGSASP